MPRGEWVLFQIIRYADSAIWRLRGDGWMWYVIRTKPGQEELVKQQVKDRMPKGISYNCRALYCVCKKRYLGKWHDEVEPFLPGHLFLVMEDFDYDLKVANEGLGMSDIVKQASIFSREMIVPVRKGEEEILKKLTCGTDEIGMSYGVIQDGILKISQGVLSGLESRVKRIDRHKRKGYIGIRLNSEERVAEVGLEITEKTYTKGII